MLYFPTRTKARTFASKADSYKAVDNGAESATGRRWGVKVL